MSPTQSYSPPRGSGYGKRAFENILPAIIVVAMWLNLSVAVFILAKPLNEKSPPMRAIIKSGTQMFYHLPVKIYRV